MAYCSFELILLMFLMLAFASASPSPTFSSFWVNELPQISLPEALRKLESPLSDSETQELLVQLKDGAPLTSSKGGSFCTEAGLYCPEKAYVSGPQPRVCIPPFFNYEYGVLPCRHPPPAAAAMHASAIFFSPASLAVGRALQLPNISNDLQSLKLLPQSISQALPKLKQGNLLKLTGLFGVQKGSSMELEMENTLAHCSYKSEHEIRACVTSGEDMVSFITKAMGSKLTVYSTPLSVMESATVVDIVKVASRGRKVASCHNMKFPSLLFSCHMSATSELMQVSLKSTDGHTTTRPAICHMDTSYWNPSHIAFQVLNLEPGKGSVCHWFPENSFIFVES